MGDSEYHGTRDAGFEEAIARRLAGYMREKLEKHAGKGHWSQCPNDYLIRRVKDELIELVGAIAGGESPEAVWREAADVANFAAMLADNYEQSREEASAHSG